MSTEVYLRPLLVELGAVVPTQGLYFTMDQMNKLDAVLVEWVVTARAPLATHLPEALCAVMGFLNRPGGT